MEKKQYSDLSNAELKLEIQRLEDLYEAKKKEAIQSLKEMDTFEQEYKKAKNELEIRKNIYL